MGAGAVFVEMFTSNSIVDNMVRERSLSLYEEALRRKMVIGYMWNALNVIVHIPIRHGGRGIDG
jgi:hypothetical protein